MVRSGSMTDMGLGLVVFSHGTAHLGSWGTLELTGRASALLRPMWAEDIALPELVATDLPAGVLLLNDELGRLLILPYAGECLIAYDLREGQPIFDPMQFPRSDDRGLRMAAVRVLPNLGAIYLTEGSLACFREDCVPAWRVDGDFAGWSFEGVTPKEVLLVAGDWSGNERRQSRSLEDGRLLHEDLS